MARRIRPLTAGDLEDLAAPLRQSFVWQVEPWLLSRLDEDAMFDVKHRWFHEIWSEWGECGQVVVVDGTPIGYLVYAPPAMVPGAEAWPTAPVARDAVLLVEAWVDPGRRRHGVARQLLQASLADLVRRGGVVGMEAYAHPSRGDRDRLPRAFLESIGFHVQREHPTAPRMRIDLRTTRRWASEVEERWARIRGGVGGKQEPATGNPAAGSVRSSLETREVSAGVS